MPYRYKRKRKKTVKKQTKLFLVIVAVCLLATGGMYLATEVLPEFFHQQVEEAIIAETEKMLSESSDSSGGQIPGRAGTGNLSPGVIGRLKTALKGGQGGSGAAGRSMKQGYGRRVDPRSARRPKRTGKGRRGGRAGKEEGMDPATIESLKKAYRGGKIDQAAVQKAKEAYSKGKIDSSMIKRAKEAYKKGNLDPALIKQAKKALAGGK